MVRRDSPRKEAARTCAALRCPRIGTREGACDTGRHDLLARMTSIGVHAGQRVALRDPRPAPGRPLETEYRPRHPLDLRRTVLIQKRGAGDPAMTTSGTVIWRASRTPDGVATLALRETHPGVIRGAAWGPGADWALGQLPALCGAMDEPGCCLHEYVPVRKARRVGVQVDAGECASVKRQPCAASLSSTGVFTSFAP